MSRRSLMRGARCLASRSGPITLVSNEQPDGVSVQVREAAPGRAEAVETTWSTVPSRLPRASMEASSVRSTISVVTPGSLA